MIWLAFALALASEPLPAAMRATVQVGPDGAEVVALSPAAGRVRDVPDGPIAVVDAAGNRLAGAALPDPRLRTVITPEGGEVAHLPSGRIQVLVPWPDGAAATRVGERLTLPTTPRQPIAASPAVAIQTSGSSASRLDLVFLADGYTAAQQDDFAADVQWIVDYLNTIQPYADYTSLLNVWRVDLVSAQSGGDHPEFGTSVDTALGCAYDCAGIDRLICCDDQLVMDAVLATVPEAEGVLVLVNDDVYGGSGGFNFAVSYVGTDQGRQVAAHELGHSLVGLWDEYGYGTPGNGEGPNCDRDADPHWTEWVGTDGVDSFQECSYTEHYRPTENGCMMRTLSDDYCPVCRQEVVRAMYARIPAILESVDPPVDSVVTRGEVVAQAVLPAARLTWEWTLDGVPVGSEPSWSVPCGSPGGELRVTVRDETHYVRSDPDGLLEDEAGPWSVEPEACPTVEDLAELCGCTTSGPPSGWLALALLPALLRRREPPPTSRRPPAAPRRALAR